MDIQCTIPISVEKNTNDRVQDHSKNNQVHQSNTTQQKTDQESRTQTRIQVSNQERLLIT